MVSRSGHQHQERCDNHHGQANMLGRTPKGEGSTQIVFRGHAVTTLLRSCGVCSGSCTDLAHHIERLEEGSHPMDVRDPRLQNDAEAEGLRCS
jgi:hypothetical protein